MTGDEEFDRWDNDIFSVEFNPETLEVRVDPERLPEFDQTIFGPQQVAVMLAEALPAVWQSVKIAEDEMAGKPMEPAYDELQEVIERDLGEMVQQRANSILGLLDKYAPTYLKQEVVPDLKAPIRWRKWLEGILHVQLSPLMVEEDPDKALEQIQARNKIVKAAALKVIQQLLAADDPDDDDPGPNLLDD